MDTRKQGVQGPKQTDPDVPEEIECSSPGSTSFPCPATPVRTLVLSGFHLTAARPSPDHIVLNVHRYDRFGVRVPYSIAIFGSDPSLSALNAFIKAAHYEDRLPLVVTKDAHCGQPLAECGFITTQEFYDALGGRIEDTLVRDDRLPDLLEQLGMKGVPEGMEGEADDLLEQAVTSCFCFLLQSRALRWGSDRRFEPLPDGIATDGRGLVVLFDCKAYENGYDVTADDMRRFSDYVNSFNRRYAAHLGPLHSFIVVSGKFLLSQAQKTDRSSQLYAACRTPLCFLPARLLGEMTRLALTQPQLRPAIDWRRTFAAACPSLANLNKDIQTMLKDRVVRSD